MKELLLLFGQQVLVMVIMPGIDFLYQKRLSLEEANMVLKMVFPVDVLKSRRRFAFEIPPEDIGYNHNYSKGKYTSYKGNR